MANNNNKTILYQAVSTRELQSWGSFLRCPLSFLHLWNVLPLWNNSEGFISAGQLSRPLEAHKPQHNSKPFLPNPQATRKIQDPRWNNQDHHKAADQLGCCMSVIKEMWLIRDQDRFQNLRKFMENVLPVCSSKQHFFKYLSSVMLVIYELRPLVALDKDSQCKGRLIILYKKEAEMEKIWRSWMTLWKAPRSWKTMFVCRRRVREADGKILNVNGNIYCLSRTEATINQSKLYCHLAAPTKVVQQKWD